MALLRHLVQFGTGAFKGGFMLPESVDAGNVLVPLVAGYSFERVPGDLSFVSYNHSTFLNLPS